MDSVADWFAIHNSATGQGVVVSRFQSTDPQGKVITPQLWVDYDDSIPATNSSTFLLLPPPGGFSGGLVTEVETLCFYDSTIWTPSLVPPLGCRTDHFLLLPWTLTFAAQTVGSTSATLRTSLTNVGPGAVKIARIVADGDFTQINDCPSALPVSGSCSIGVTFTPSGAGIRSGSVSINSLLPSSPQVLSLAGLGVAAN